MISAISEDSFLTQAFAFLCVFSFGLSFACLLKILLPAKQKEVKNVRFAFLCLFLSFTVILYTILIFSAKSLSWPLDFSKNRQNYFVVLSVIFVLGSLISFFWKVAGPVFLTLYISFSLFTNSVLKEAFGPQKQIIPIHIEENSSPRDFSLIYCRLPDTLALPVKRNWFYAGEKLPESESKLLKNSLVSFYEKKILLKNLSEAKKIPIPKSEVYPSLYSARIGFKDNEIVCEIARDL